MPMISAASEVRPAHRRANEAVAAARRPTTGVRRDGRSPPACPKSVGRDDLSGADETEEADDGGRRRTACPTAGRRAWSTDAEGAEGHGAVPGAGAAGPLGDEQPQRCADRARRTCGAARALGGQRPPQLSRRSMRPADSKKDRASRPSPGRRSPTPCRASRSAPSSRPVMMPATTWPLRSSGARSAAKGIITWPATDNAATASEARVNTHRLGARAEATRATAVEAGAARRACAGGGGRRAERRGAAPPRSRPASP